ncbi:hypothetical protein [Streptomyces tailanensis]|uniref:hypothetical protein n=1 Tax=Streptomyces tailanensis TaxID=2569858 RepID=UPI00122E341D|nr:hypothetical protein [Streptomyces tailanensis]
MGDAEIPAKIPKAELHRMVLDRAGKWKDRGTVLLILAALLWGYVAWQLLLPEESSGCDGALFERQKTADGNVPDCAAERPWPRLLGVLGLCVPVSIAGAVLYTKGTLGILMSHHTMALTDGRR